MTLHDLSVSTLALWPVVESCRAARRFAEETLTAWGLDDAAVYNGTVVVNELVTNAVQQSKPRQDIVLRLFLGANALPVVEVQDGVDAKPDLRTPAVDAEDGRGLFLVDNLCESWGTNPVAGGGKVVWAVLPLIIERRPGRPS